MAGKRKDELQSSENLQMISAVLLDSWEKPPVDVKPLFFLTPGDAVDFLRSTPDEFIDLIVTDPPYESLEKHRKVGTTTRLKHSAGSSNDWFQIFPNVRFPELFYQCYRVLRPNSHMYMFCDQETMFVAKPMAEAAGFTFRSPLVWDKAAIGMGYHYRARYEFILLLEKGERLTKNPDLSDIIKCKRIVHGYPTEKPSAVSRVLIEQSSDPGNVVCDPFMGSGSVGVAALECGRTFRGCDLSQTAYEAAQKRLMAWWPPPDQTGSK